MHKVTDKSKAVRNKRYKLIHNYMPDVPTLPIIEYREELRSMHAFRTEELSSDLLKGYLNPKTSEYELYDLKSDPNEIHNLSSQPQYREILDDLKTTLQHWINSAPDLSAMTEKEMVRPMWPDYERPKTLPPTVQFRTLPDGTIKMHL